MYKPQNRLYIPDKSTLMKSNEDDAIRKIEAMQAVTFGNGQGGYQEQYDVDDGEDEYINTYEDAYDTPQ